MPCKAPQKKFPVVEDEARGRSLFEGSALEEGAEWRTGSPTFLSIIFFSSRGLLLTGKLSGQSLKKKWVALLWVLSVGGCVKEEARVNEGRKKKWVGAGVD
jgi:hypothetical protein